MSDKADKVFDLVEKVYIELQDTRKELQDTKIELSARLDKVEQGQKRLETVIENDIKTDINALYDGYRQVYEKLQEHDRRFDTLESKLEKQDVEIRVIKGGSKKVK